MFFFAFLNKLIPIINHIFLSFVLLSRYNCLKRPLIFLQFGYWSKAWQVDFLLLLGFFLTDMLASKLLVCVFVDLLSHGLICISIVLVSLKMPLSLLWVSIVVVFANGRTLLTIYKSSSFLSSNSFASPSFIMNCFNNSSIYT